MLRFLSRSDVDTAAWDACVSASPQCTLYGYSWYLDAVTCGNSWQWVGLVLPGEASTYRAVMPVPLRRKWGTWVVYQPLFCHFLNVFISGETLDETPFYQALQQRYRYGSVLCLQSSETLLPTFDNVRQRTTQLLNLSVEYDTLARQYTRDRKLNLRRALQYGWTVTDSPDPEPLLALFRANHAAGIEGGVGEWAYDILRMLIQTLQNRKLATIRYALSDGQIEAGVLFVAEGNRIIYLFNAASKTGRTGNARTLLIDRQIRENAGRSVAGKPLLFDFESPQKQSIIDFYASFGATDSVFAEVRWNRLPTGVRTARRLLMRFRRVS